MSNKLTALTSATLPLAGTEAVYVVQGGNSRQTTAGAVIASCSIIASNETITGTKTYNSGKLQLAGSTSGITILNATATASGTLTLPAATDTLVGRATTDTLSNKAIDGGSNTITNISLTTGVTGLLPLANGGTNANAANAARLNLVTPTYAAYASIPSLSTTNDKSVICTDENLGYAGTFNWVGSSLTSKTVLQSQTTTSISGNVITLAGHNLSTGAGILTTTAVNGLSTQTVYWVINLSSSTFSLATTVENAINSVVLTLTGTTNFTFQQLLDPLQDIYVIPTGSDLAGSNGAWVRASGQTNAGVFRGNYNRMNDRLLLGTGATSWMGDHSGTTSSSGVGSWLYDEVPAGATQRMSYLLTNASLAVVPNYTVQSQYGIVGAVRTPDGATTRSALGVAGYGSGHSTSGTSVAWGGYFEGRKVAGATSTAQGAEIEISNANSTPVAATLAPNWAYVQGQTMGLFLASGGGNSAGVYDADYALLMSNNGAKFRTGIVIGSASLTQDAGTSYQHALLLPSKGRIEWYDSTTNNTSVCFAIHSEITTSAHQTFMIASDTGLAINGSGTVLTNGSGLGYGTGAGGTVTQATSRTTGVTINKATGAITMFSAAGSATAATFTVTNSTVAATDTIILNQKSGTNLYNFIVTAVAAGSFNITFYTTGGTATDAPVINFNVIKGVTA